MFKAGERVAVVGAGLAGSLVAERLQRAGALVTVFDKSRGTGGRLAAARIGDLSIDLGAPGLNARQHALLSSLLTDTAGPGLACWQPVSTDFDFSPSRQGSRLWLSQPRSSGLTRTLLEGIDLRTQVRIAQVQRLGEASFLLKDDADVSCGRFDRVVVATPAPQAVSLLSSDAKLQDVARQIQMQSCWVLLLQLEQRPQQLAAIDWLEGEHPVLHRVWRDSSKPGRGGETWVAEARADWSLQQLDAKAEQVQSVLFQAFSAICHQSVEPVHLRAHRWLYARTVASSTPLFSSEDSRLGICGDWVSGGSLEGAIKSARQLVQRIIDGP